MSEQQRIDIEKRVIKVTAKMLGLNEKKIHPNSNFSRSLGADSLDLVELAMAFEDEFNITFTDEISIEMRTLRDVTKYVMEHLENDVDFEDIIKYAPVKDIREKVMAGNFHKIKHTKAFGILLTRLDKAETESAALKGVCEQFLGGLSRKIPSIFNYWKDKENRT